MSEEKKLGQKNRNNGAIRTQTNQTMNRNNKNKSEQNAINRIKMKFATTVDTGRRYNAIHNNIKQGYENWKYFAGIMLIECGQRNKTKTKKQEKKIENSVCTEHTKHQKKNVENKYKKK